MALILNDRPGRWIRYCPTAPGFDYCAAVNQGDFDLQPWIIAGDSSLTGIYVLPDSNGLIDTIDTHPTGTLYDETGSAVTTMSYNAGLGYYTPASEVSVTDNQYLFEVPAMDVTLFNGDSCSVTFSQFFQGEGGPSAPALYFSTTKQTGMDFVITGGSGTINWGDDSEDAFDATGGPTTPTHTYASPGTYTINIYCTATDVTALDISNRQITGTVGIDKCTSMTSFQGYTNTALSSIANPVSSANWTVYTAYSTGLTSWDASGLSGLGGDVRLHACTSMTTVSLPTSSQAFTFLYFYDNTSLTGINASGLTGLSGGFNCRGCSVLTSLTLPTSSGVITDLSFYNCNITGSVDCSGLTAIQGTFRADGNPNMTACTMPTSAGLFSKFYAYNTGIVGVWDISGLTGLKGDIRVYSNSAMTNITFPTSSQSITTFNIYSNGFTGTLDVSGLTGFVVMVASGNSSMTNVTFPASSPTITNIDVQDCNLDYFDGTSLTYSSAVLLEYENNGMVVADVNHHLVDWDATLPVIGTGTLRIDESNAAPDATSGGYNGTAAKTNLVAAGYSVFTS